MTNNSDSSYEYKTDGVNSSLGVLVIRIMVGLPIGIVAGFIGNLSNGLLVPSPAAGDNVAFIIRMLVIGSATAAGGMVAWFNVYESKSGATRLWAVASIGGTVGAIIAYFIGDAYITPPDVYILNQRLVQVVILGAGIGANVLAVIMSVVSARLGR